MLNISKVRILRWQHYFSLIVFAFSVPKDIMIVNLLICIRRLVLVFHEFSVNEGY